MSAHRALLPLARRSLLPSFRSPSAETVGAAGSPIASCWPAHRHCLSNWRGGLSTNASSSPSAVLRPVPFSSHSLRSSSSHFGVAPSYRRRLVSTSADAASPLASGGDGGGDDEEEDEFAEIGFEDDEEVDLTVEDTPAVSLTPAELEDAASLTPELAAEVVARMVQAATTGTDGGGGAASASSPVTTTADGGNSSTPPPPGEEAAPAGAARGSRPRPALTAEAVTMLRAATLQSHTVFQAGRLPMPITRKVTAFVAVEQLRRGLSAPALAAVLALAGLRYRPAEGVIKLPVDRHPTADANRATAVLLMGQLLRAAKASVGEALADDRGIQGGWAGLAAEVERQAERDGDNVSVGLLALAADDWREIQAARRARRG